jgi:hypothetical protein
MAQGNQLSNRRMDFSDIGFQGLEDLSIRLRRMARHERFVGELTLAPERAQPSIHIPFPRVTDMDGVVMTYKEDGGMVRAPRSVTVHGHGQIVIGVNADNAMCGLPSLGYR